MKKAGVLGGGQLGKMMGLAGLAMGLEMRYWEPSVQSPAASTGEHICAPYDDEQAAEAFLQGLDVITYEFENVPVAILHRLEKAVPVRPGINALTVSQDRLLEKTFFGEAGVPTGQWHGVESEADLLAAFEEFGECIVKTRRFGYDGKGQFRVSSKGDCHETWKTAGSQPLIVEKVVRFDRELSLVGVRSQSGDVSTWPLVENVHRNGILRKTTAPAPDISARLQRKADDMLRAVMESLSYVGVLTIELFEIEGELLANEMAPRVHNSGHWTIEGAVTSQFENHLRAVTGMPLGSTALRFPSVMVNCIGAMPTLDDSMRIGGVHLHDYGKAPRENRKVGHITLCDEDGSMAPLEERVAALEALIALTPVAADK